MIFSVRGQAQTYNAASCNSSDVQTALNSAVSSGRSAVTVTIPAGTCTWSTGVSVTVPSSTPNFTLIGAGNQSVVGGGDATVIVDNISRTGSDIATIHVTPGGAGTTFRLSGVTLQQSSCGSSCLTYNGLIGINGGANQGSQVRIDHIHCINIAALCGGVDNIYGVVDHSLFDQPAGAQQGAIRVNADQWGGQTQGNGSWSSPSNFGSGNFFFYEDNVFNNGFATDCEVGGRYVFRYNTVKNSYIQTHRLQFDVLACRELEAYNNTFIGTLSNATSYAALFLTNGTGVIWGNTVTGTGYSHFVQFVNQRRLNTDILSAPPNGWGMCGTTYANTGGSNSPNGPSNWDGNQDSSGYPCINQIGRGAGDLIQGYTPKVCDKTSSQCANNNYMGSWPNEALEPVYEWNDTLSSGDVYVYANDPTIQKNRDFYTSTVAFNGTSGVGSGLLSLRPSSCTAGPGGNTNGVAYWATDTNTLYVCNPTDTWTIYYTPYKYPHPLVTGSTSNLLTAPTALLATVQ